VTEEERVLREFLRWGASQKRFPYGELAHWIAEYVAAKRRNETRPK
jgi:hypothetical protein